MAAKLTAKMVDNVGAGSYSDGGGVGVMLLVRPTGGKFWIQRIAIHGKKRDIGLGSYPVITLAKAPLTLRKLSWLSASLPSIEKLTR